MTRNYQLVYYITQKWVNYRDTDVSKNEKKRQITPYLKVTTACKVVLLPSSQPLGRIPGDPQLISRQIDRQIDRQIVRKIDIQIARQIDRQVDCSLYSYHSSNYFDSKSYRFFLLLKKIAISFSLHFAIAFKSDKDP